jgi:hypothetical protein
MGGRNGLLGVMLACGLAACASVGPALDLGPPGPGEGKKQRRGTYVPSKRVTRSDNSSSLDRLLRKAKRR